MQRYNNGTGNKEPRDTILQLPPLAFLRSGDYGYSGGGLSNRTSDGYYWSDRLSNSLDFSSSVLRPQGGSARGYGFSLRCLARIEPKGTTATLPALLLILYVPKVGDYRGIVGKGRIWNY